MTFGRENNMLNNITASSKTCVCVCVSPRPVWYCVKPPLRRCLVRYSEHRYRQLEHSIRSLLPQRTVGQLLSGRGTNLIFNISLSKARIRRWLTAWRTGAISHQLLGRVRLYVFVSVSCTRCQNRLRKNPDYGNFLTGNFANRECDEGQNEVAIKGPTFCKIQQ